MPYQTLDSVETVQVYSPTLVADAIFVTIRSFPSGSILVRTVPLDIFNKDGTSPILASLADAVENLLDGGLATAATGTQGIDGSGLIYDAVTFTVTYVPDNDVPGELTATVEIPVNVVTADPAFAGAPGFESAVERIEATYNRLRNMASGG